MPRDGRIDKKSKFKVLTNRKNVLSNNSTLAEVVTEDVMPAPPRPNIIIILADNMGYMDPGCYGGGAVLGAPTPRMDQMAAEGLRLTSFYLGIVDEQCMDRAIAYIKEQADSTGLSMA
jgi:hypothetical protein